MPDAQRFLPLSNLSFQILLALGKAPSHGYGIGKELAQRTDGKLNPTTGSLYQALRRLEDDGLIEEAPEATAEAGDTRRQYFRLTELGRTVAGLEARRLAELVDDARARDLFPA